MKKILGLVVYAAVMFGVTAGLGVVMMKMNAPANPDSIEDSGNPGGAPSDAQTSLQSSGSQYIMTANASSGLGGVPASGVGSGAKSSLDSGEQLPVAVRASPMSVEEIVRMGLSLKARDEALRKRETSIRDAEAQQRLVQSDVEAAKQEVENVLSQATDQRAAIEELVGRVNAQKEAISNERQSIASEQQQLKADRDKLDADRRSFEAEKTALTQRETDLQLKRNELDADRQKFESERTKLKIDSEQLVKERDKYVLDYEQINKEKGLVASEKEALRVERLKLEQDKRLLASTPGAAALPSQQKPLDPESVRVNQKNTTELLEGMTPERAAGVIKQLSADGQMDMVVEVLVKLEQRKVSAILEALDDDVLVTEFINKVNSRKTDPKSARN